MKDLNRLPKMNLQLFAEDPNAGGTGGNDPNAGDKGGNTEKVTFTPEQQAEVDRIIAERLARANATASKRALEEQAKALGFETYAELEAAVKAQKAAQEKEKTDLQREQEAKQAAEQRAQQAEAKAKQALIKSAFVAAAAGANLVNIEDAFQLADLTAVTVSDEGQVDGVKEAVEALVKAKPYLVQAGGTQQTTGGNPARGHGQSKEQADKTRAGNIAAQRLGVKQAPTTDAIAAAVAAAVAQVLGGDKK